MWVVAGATAPGGLEVEHGGGHSAGSGGGTSGVWPLYTACYGRGQGMGRTGSGGPDGQLVMRETSLPGREHCRYVCALRFERAGSGAAGGSRRVGLLEERPRW